MRLFGISAFLAIWFLSGSEAFAQEECLALTDDRERLECFDSAFSSDPELSQNQTVFSEYHELSEYSGFQPNGIMLEGFSAYQSTQDPCSISFVYVATRTSVGFSSHHDYAVRAIRSEVNFRDIQSLDGINRRVISPSARLVLERNREGSTTSVDGLLRVSSAFTNQNPPSFSMVELGLALLDGHRFDGVTFGEYSATASREPTVSVLPKFHEADLAATIDLLGQLTAICQAD